MERTDDWIVVNLPTLLAVMHLVTILEDPRDVVYQWIKRNKLGTTLERDLD